MAIDFKGIGEGFKDWKTGNLIVAAIVVLAVYFNNDISEYFKDLRIEEKRVESKRDFLDLTDRSTEVKMNMEKLREHLGADRVTLIKFHNGVTYKDGSHFEKYSIVNVAENRFLDPMDSKFTDIPLEMHSWYFGEVIRDKARFYDVSQVSDFSTRTMFEAYGVTSHIGVPLFQNGEFVGTMTINWILSKPDSDKILNYFGMDAWDSDELYRRLSIQCQDIYDINSKPK